MRKLIEWPIMIFYLQIYSGEINPFSKLWSQAKYFVANVCDVILSEIKESNVTMWINPTEWEPNGCY